jgi:hypothetical protein
MDLVLPAREAKGYPAATADRLSSILGRDLAEAPAIVPQQLAAMRGHDVTGHLGALSGIPTLVISGSDDLLAPPATAGQAAGSATAAAASPHQANIASTKPLPIRVIGGPLRRALQSGRYPLPSQHYRLWQV